MRLSPKAVKEFSRIYEKEYGKPLSYEEAELMAKRFLEFIHMISHPPEQDEDS